MNKLGIDIGSSHTKIIEVGETNGKKTIVKFAIFPSGSLYEAIMDPNYNKSKSAISHLKKILSEAKFSTNVIRITMPDFKIVTKVLTLPIVTGDKHIQQAIEFVAEEHLPQPISETIVKYTVIKENLYDPKSPVEVGFMPRAVNFASGEKKGTMDVLLVAVPKQFVEGYIYLMNKVGLEIEGLEPNSTTSSRVLSYEQHEIPTIIVEIGSSYTDFILTVDGSVRFVRTMNIGISTLVKSISEELGLTKSQAENYLYTYGLNNTQLGEKIKAPVEPVLSVIIQEMQKFQTYVEERIRFSKLGEQNKIKSIVISGGGAVIPNFVVYLINKVGQEISYADPWKQLDISNVEQKSLLKFLAPIFTSVAGTMLK